mgnify:CR=1 FL=1
MTGHHGNAMIWNSYAHLDLKPETIVEKQKYVLEESVKPEAGYVLFGGRILNMEAALEKRLLKNIRRRRCREEFAVTLPDVKAICGTALSVIGS